MLSSVNERDLKHLIYNLDIPTRDTIIKDIKHRSYLLQNTLDMSMVLGVWLHNHRFCVILCMTDYLMFEWGQIGPLNLSSRL